MFSKIASGGPRETPGRLQESMLKRKSTILGQVALGGPRDAPGKHFNRKIDHSVPGGARRSQGGLGRLGVGELREANLFFWKRLSKQILF